jgi:hypothetical protein
VGAQAVLQQADLSREGVTLEDELAVAVGEVAVGEARAGEV